MISLDELIETCTDWDGCPWYWSEVVHMSISLIPNLVKNVAKEFEIAESTVLNWSKGYGNPHPLIKRQILNHISKLGMEVKTC